MGNKAAGTWKKVALALRSISKKNGPPKRIPVVETLSPRKLLAADDSIGAGALGSSGPAQLLVGPIAAGNVQPFDESRLDVNGDSIRTPLDALLIVNAVSRGDTVEKFPAGDVDGDGLIRKNDAAVSVNSFETSSK